MQPRFLIIYTVIPGGFYFLSTEGYDSKHGPLLHMSTARLKPRIYCICTAERKRAAGRI